MRTFAEAFRVAVRENGVSLAELSRATGVSLEQLKKINQGKTLKTNAEDAMLIAKHFGQTLEDFVGDPNLKAPLRIIELYNSLDPELRQRLEGYGEGLADDQE